jgi:tetratricopeptide (TPR) repeat protein
VAEVADGERTLKGAVELKRKLFGSDGVRYAAAVADLAGFYSTQARMAESLPLFEEAIAIESRVFGENDRRVLERLGGLARVYQVLGDNARAEATAQRGLSGLVAAGLGTTAEAGAAWSRLGSIAAARKDYAVAVERHQKAVEIRRGLKHPDLSTSLGFLGECLAALGRDEEALAHMAESIAIDRGAGFPKADASNGFVPYAALLEKLGRVGDAEKALAEALSISRVRLADHPWRATQEVAMGRLLVRRDRHAEAAACFKAAVEILKARRAGKVEEVEALLREAEEKAGAKAAAPG